MNKPSRKEVLSSPLLKKGGQHEKTKKAKRRNDKVKLKSEWGCQNTLVA